MHQGNWVLLLLNFLGIFGQPWTVTQFLSLYPGPGVQLMPWGIAWKPDMSSMFVAGYTPQSTYCMLRYDYPNGITGAPTLGCKVCSNYDIADLIYYRGRLFGSNGVGRTIAEYDPNNCSQIQANTVTLPGGNQILGMRVDPISGDIFACSVYTGIYRFPIPPVGGTASSYTKYYNVNFECDGMHFDYDGTLWIVDEACNCLIHLPPSTAQTNPSVTVTAIGQTVNLGPVDGIASTLGSSGTPPSIIITNNNNAAITAYYQTNQTQSVIYSGSYPAGTGFRGDFCVTAQNGCVYTSHQLGFLDNTNPTPTNPESVWQICPNFIPDNNPCLPHPCDTNAECTPGGSSDFTCDCNSGYTGNGFTCQPQTTIQVDITPPPTCGSPFTLTATLSSVASTEPTGDVTFTIYDSNNNQVGTPLVGTANQQNPDTATVTVSNLPVGDYTVVTTYPGDSTTSPATTTTPFHVDAASVTMGAVQVNPTSPHCGEPFTASVSLSSPCATPTGTVTFTFDNGNGGVYTFNGTIDSNGVATATIPHGLPFGHYTVTADYEGDESSRPVQVNNGVGVNKADCFLDLGLNVNLQVLIPSLIRWTATGLPQGASTSTPTGGYVHLNDGANTIANVTLLAGHANGHVTLLSVGLHPLKLGYDGDHCFNPCISGEIDILGIPL